MYISITHTHLYMYISITHTLIYVLGQDHEVQGLGLNRMENQTHRALILAFTLSLFYSLFFIIYFNLSCHLMNTPHPPPPPSHTHTHTHIKALSRPSLFSPKIAARQRGPFLSPSQCCGHLMSLCCSSLRLQVCIGLSQYIYIYIYIWT